ncbi:MAG: hypothetical protein ACK55Z_28405 [bacterium]
MRSHSAEAFWSIFTFSLVSAATMLSTDAYGCRVWLADKVARWMGGALWMASRRCSCLCMACSEATIPWLSTRECTVAERR